MGTQSKEATLMFKFDLDQTVYLILDNRVHSAPVLSRMLVENHHPKWDATKEQAQFFKRFGNCRVMYSTCHGEFSEQELFDSRQALASAILEHTI
jgi:hypothetical protein